MDAEELYRPCRDIGFLYPPFASAILTGIDACRTAGLDVWVYEGFRLSARQSYLYAQGRTRPGKVVTQAPAELTWHEYGVAVDLVFGGPGKWTWNGPYQKVGRIMLETRPELTWLGAEGQPFIDPPHFQMTFGLKVEEARAIKRKGGMAAVFAEFEKRRKH